MMRELGCHVIEADPLAHQLMEPGQAAYEEVVLTFGAGILSPERRIDRRKLGEIVFADFEKLLALNRIVHPRVIEAIDGELADAARSGEKNLAVVEAALLIESGYYEKLDRLIVVWCRPEQQRERLLARGISPEQIERRIVAQMPLEQKRRMADDEIDCSGSLSATKQQVERLVARLKQLAAAS